MIDFRILYLVGCGLNSIAMMSVGSMLFVLISLSTFWFLAQYHILTMLMMIGVILIISVLVKICTNLIGIDSGSVDKIILPQLIENENIILRLGN